MHNGQRIEKTDGLGRSRISELSWWGYANYARNEGVLEVFLDPGSIPGISSHGYGRFLVGFWCIRFNYCRIGCVHMLFRQVWGSSPWVPFNF